MIFYGRELLRISGSSKLTEKQFLRALNRALSLLYGAQLQFLNEKQLSRAWKIGVKYAVETG